MLGVTSREIARLQEETERLIREQTALERNAAQSRRALRGSLYGALAQPEINAGRNTLIDYFEEGS